MKASFLSRCPLKRKSVPEKSGTRKKQTLLFFFHPDYTVGSGISPDQQAARGLPMFERVTAGGDFHPAPKTAIKFI
jgi:hypothetical protein